MGNTIHRKSRSGSALCGLSLENEYLTLHDDKVTCDRCKEILEQIKFTSTKTRTINKFIVDKKVGK